MDSWHKGASDNGTANACMLEAARILSAHRDRLRRGIRFVWWSGHSHGRYSGSNWYADHHWEDLHRNAIVHMNMLGATARGLDNSLMKLSRILMPVNYSAADPFEPDLAVPIPPRPRLQPAAELAAMDRSGAPFKFLERKMVRERTRVCHALAQAADLIDDTLERLARYPRDPSKSPCLPMHGVSCPRKRASSVLGTLWAPGFPLARE